MRPSQPPIGISNLFASDTIDERAQEQSRSAASPGLSASVAQISIRPVYLRSIGGVEGHPPESIVFVLSGCVEFFPKAVRGLKGMVRDMGIDDTDEWIKLTENTPE